MSLFYADRKQSDEIAYPKLDERQDIKKEDPTFQRKQKMESEEMGRNMRKSIMLKDEEGEEPTWCTRCCACTKLEYYKDYFKVTNKDVVKRMMSSLQFWQAGFFQPMEQDYDFYGPFWIYTTIVFCLGAVHNIINYQVIDPFEYDFSVVGSAFGFMYIEGFGFPILFTFLLKFLGLECQHIHIICLYGYAMTTCIPALLLCSLNVCILHIILLAYAMGAKAAFVFKNLNQGFPIPSTKKIIVIAVIVAEAVLQFFVFKLVFIICASAPEEAVAPLSHHSLSSHMRNFQV